MILTTTRYAVTGMTRRGVLVWCYIRNGKFAVSTTQITYAHGPVIRDLVQAAQAAGLDEVTVRRAE